MKRSSTASASKRPRKKATGSAAKGKGKGKGKAAAAKGGKGKGKGKAKAAAAPATARDLKAVNALAADEVAALAQREHVTLASLGITGVHEVAELDEAGVMGAIEAVAVRIAMQVLRGGAFSYVFPKRSNSNQQYVPELDRIVLKHNTSTRSFLATQEVRKTAIMTRVMELLHRVLDKRIHVTKRDLFYTDVKLFVKQAESDGVLDDLACMLGCARHSMNVVASAKGVVVGRLVFDEAGDEIDCTRMGTGGKAIPAYTDQITNFRSDAKFILLVEKDAAFMRLAEDRFYNDFPCIIITAKGQPDVSSRKFLKKVKEALRIPVLALVDSDPYGLKILSVYAQSSKSMSYDSAGLTTHGIKWLGVRPSDLDAYDIPEQCRLKMTDSDIKMGKALLEESFVKQNPEWVKELQLMLKRKEKAEIQALSSFGFQYLSKEYLPQKIRAGNWV